MQTTNREDPVRRHYNLSMYATGSSFYLNLFPENSEGNFIKSIEEVWKKEIGKFNEQIEEKALAQDAIEKRRAILGRTMDEVEESKHGILADMERRFYTKPKNMSKYLVKVAQLGDELAKCREDPNELQILAMMVNLGCKLDHHTFEAAIQYAQNERDADLERRLTNLNTLRMIADLSLGELNLLQLLEPPTEEEIKNENRTRRRMLGMNENEKEYGVELLQGYEVLGLRRGVVSYSDLLKALVVKDRWAQTLEIFDSMRQQSLPLSLQMCNNALIAMANTRNWYRAMKLLAEMHETGIGWDTDTRQILDVIGYIFLNETGFDWAMKRVDNFTFEFDSTRPTPSSYISKVDESFEVPREEETGVFDLKGNLEKGPHGEPIAEYMKFLKERRRRIESLADEEEERLFEEDEKRGEIGVTIAYD
mmetsp:Transcript_24337/g.58751  ORF Transcript_24337/g.58751 Transcript_24337/m.58751 type:complete len:422 (-) Transcript_24337:136-1401(-)